MKNQTNIEKLITSGKKVIANNVLDGLGELLTDAQKDSIRATLKRDVLFDLRSRVEV